MICLGLDLSISSTGACVYDSETKKTHYYIISNKFTKKALSYKNELVTFKEYERARCDARDNYCVKEYAKTLNIYNIVEHIKNILSNHCVDVVAIEGVSFGSSGAVADLAGLNYAVRLQIMRSRSAEIYIVSPTQNKKFATSNGAADKELMISAWHKADPQTTEIPDYIKQDDLADAYFLARYGEVLNMK